MLCTRKKNYCTIVNVSFDMINCMLKYNFICYKHSYCQEGHRTEVQNVKILKRTNLYIKIRLLHRMYTHDLS